MLEKNNFFSVLKNFFFITTVFSFGLSIFIKYKIFQLKNNVRAVENEIIQLEKQKNILDLELAYLTRPDRLKELYGKVKKLRNNEHFSNKELVSINQIRDIKTLIPYYYAKLEQYNSKHSIASK
jgi:cell division protein FtsL